MILIFKSKNKIKDLFIMKPNTIDILIYMYILVYYINDSLYLQIIMNDGIIMSIDLLQTYLQSYTNTFELYNNYNKLIENNMVNIIDYIKHPNINYNSKNSKVVNKYIYYVLLIIIKYICQIFFWTNNHYYINSLLLFFTIRPIKSLIYNWSYFNKLSKKVIDLLYNLFIYLLSKFSAYIINKSDVLCIEISPKIKYYELFIFFDKIHHFKENIITIIKLISNYVIIRWLRNSKSSFIKYIFTFIHKYQIEELSYITNLFNKSNKFKQFDELNLQSNKTDISNIISSRQWNKLLTQKSINNILSIIETDIPIQTKNNKQIEITILQYMTCWTCVYINPVLAIIVDLFFVYNDKKITLFKIIGYIMGYYICLLNYLDVGTFVFIYSSNIIKILFNFVKDINIYKLYNYTTKYILLSYIISIILIVLINYNIIIPTYGIYQLYLIKYIDCIIFKNNILFYLLFFLLYLTNLNIFHLSSVCILLYVISLFICETEYKLYCTVNENYIDIPKIDVEPISYKWVLFNNEKLSSDTISNADYNNYEIISIIDEVHYTTSENSINETSKTNKHCSSVSSPTKVECKTDDQCSSVSVPTFVECKPENVFVIDNYI